eukprot:3547-Pyramimonas_sp.AAC.1
MDYARRVANMEASAPGALHKITKPKKRREDECVKAGRNATNPKDSVDLKAEDFEEMWKHSSKHEDAAEAINMLRERAQEEPAPCWALDEFDDSIN